MYLFRFNSRVLVVAFLPPQLPTSLSLHTFQQNLWPTYSWDPKHRLTEPSASWMNLNFIFQTFILVTDDWIKKGCSGPVNHI